MSSTGQPVKLARPLDWLAVSDHSDGMGVIDEITSGHPTLMTDPVLKKCHQQFNAGGKDALAAVMDLIARQSSKQLPAAVMERMLSKTVWEKSTAIIEKRLIRTSRAGLPRSSPTSGLSNYGGGNNLHRNVIYRDGKDKADQMVPMTTFDSENPEDLWTWMATWEQKTGGSLLAIPHNGNLSNGLMLNLRTFEGKPLTKAWAESRARWEPLFEVTQGKGTSEQHPSLSPTTNSPTSDVEQGQPQRGPKSWA